MNLLDAWLAVVQENPTAPALVYQDEVWSRQRLQRLTAQIAQQLHQRGVKPGDMVGLALDQTPEHIAAMLAVARVGAISLPLHSRSRRQQRERLLKRFEANWVVSKQLLVLPNGTGLINLSELPTLTAADRPDLHFSDYWPTPETPARIGLTSGTTGEPNAILYSHGYWLHRIRTTIDNCDADTRITPSNLHLTLGNLTVFAALFAGGMVIFPPARQRHGLFDTIRRYSITHALTSPASVLDLATLAEDEGIAFPSLRHLRIVGGGMTERQIRVAKEKLTPNLYLPYGLSEVGAVSIATPELLDSHPTYAGRCKEGVQVEALDEQGEPLPPGEEGLLRILVPGMPQHYYDRPEASAERFRDGWFYSSDVGRVTADGLIQISGRDDDRINLGGRKFHAEQVERVLLNHPEVSDAAVVGHENGQGRKVLMALVVLNHEGAPRQKLQPYCRQQRLGDLVPHRFLLMSELPRNEAGKLQRSELAKLLPAAPRH